MKTRIVFTLFLAILTIVSLHAQEGDEEMKMLFNKKDKSPNEKMANGGYGSFTMGWTQINGENALLIGGRAAWVANHHFALGLAGRGFFSNFDNNGNYNPSYDPNYDPNFSLAGGYGGLLLEPIVAWKSPVNVSFPILIGAGGVTATPAQWEYVDNYNTYYYQATAFFVLEPGVDLQFNITKFFRIALGASYRLTSNINMDYIYYEEGTDNLIVDPVPTNALRNFNVDLSLKFGWF